MISRNIIISKIAELLRVYDSVIDIIIDTYKYLKYEMRLKNIELKQGWHIDISDNFSCKATLFIEMKHGSYSEYVAVLNRNTVILNRKFPDFMSKRFPSYHKISKLRLKYS